MATPKPRAETAIAPTQLSTAQFNRAANSIQLLFSGDLEAESASDTNSYRLQSNGRAVTVESASYDSHRHLVSLSVAEPLPNGAALVAQWHGLRNAQGRAVQDGAVALK